LRLPVVVVTALAVSSLVLGIAMSALTQDQGLGQDRGQGQGQHAAEFRGEGRGGLVRSGDTVFVFGQSAGRDASL
jgi:hypothetical protein